MRKLLIILAFCNVHLFLQGQPDFYNLSLRDSHASGWVSSGVFSQVGVDSAQRIKGKYAICLRQVSVMEQFLPLSGELSRSLYFPETSGNGECSVSIRSRCANIGKAQMKISAFDSSGWNIFCDSFEINNANMWRESHLNFSVKGAKFLSLRIQAEGSGQPAGGEQKMWIDSVGVTVDGFDMSSFDLNMLPPPTPVTRDAVVPLSLKNEETFMNVEALRAKRIVAVGESVHGAREFAAAAFSIIKNQVVHNHCRLVALEIPFALGLKWNLYVQQAATFDSSEIKNDLKQLLCFPEDMLNFLTWLKRYNENAPRKVRLFGMDANMLDGGAYDGCYSDYFYEHLPKDSSLFASLYIDNVYHKKVEVLSTIRQNRSLIESYLGKKEVALLCKSLESPTIGIGLQNAARFMLTGRDSIMFGNLSYAIDTELEDCETAIVYAHLLHVGKRNVENNCLVSLGQYLCSAYGENYFPIGLFTYQGNELDKERLEPAQPYSLEMQCKSVGIPCFYSLSSNISPPFIRIRRFPSEDNRAKNSFEFVPFRYSVDAFIYVNSVSMISVGKKEVSSAEYKPDMLRKVKRELNNVKMLENIRRNEHSVAN
jgi:hypothetical protein